MTTTVAEPVTMDTLQKRCAVYDAACADLEAMILAVEADLDEVKRKHLPVLKRQAGVVAAREAALRADLEAAPDLFVKPRTAVFHGVKIGWTTGKGRIEWDDEQQVLLLIKRNLPKRQADLISTFETPNKNAIKNLPAKLLARIGCRHVFDEIPLLHRVAGDVEALVNKLIQKMVAAMTDAEG